MALWYLWTILFFLLLLNYVFFLLYYVFSFILYFFAFILCFFTIILCLFFVLFNFCLILFTFCNLFLPGILSFILKQLVQMWCGNFDVVYGTYPNGESIKKFKLRIRNRSVAKESIWQVSRYLRWKGFTAVARALLLFNSCSNFSGITEFLSSNLDRRDGQLRLIVAERAVTLSSSCTYGPLCTLAAAKLMIVIIESMGSMMSYAVKHTLP